MPAVLRLLLPIVVALAMVVQPVTTWAAAGVTGVVTCCCPDPDQCECFDHAGEHHDAPRLKRCGGGALELAAPTPLVATVPPSPPVLSAPRVLAAPSVTVTSLIARRPARPDKPPS